MADYTSPDILQHPMSLYAAMPPSTAEKEVEYPLAPQPSNDQLVAAIRRILATADLASTTKKRIRSQLAQEFNVDMKIRKEFISDTVDNLLSSPPPTFI